MIIEVIESIVSAIKTGGSPAVYTAYDTVPLERKKGFFVIVGVANLIGGKSVAACTPFKAAVEVCTVGGKDSSAAELYAYFEEAVYPKVISVEGYAGIRNIGIKSDKEMNRLVLKCEFEYNGVYLGGEK